MRKFGAAKIFHFTVVSPVILLLIQEGLLSVISEYMCTKYSLRLSQISPGKRVVR